jgi:hypothetical protein
LNDWDGSNAFADIGMHGRNWQAASDWHNPVEVDAQGWPTADASTVFFGEGNRTGRYHLRFEGRAQSVSVMWLAGTVDSLAWDSTTNISTAVVDMKGPMGGSGGLVLTGTRRTSGAALGTGFRNLHLWRPGYPPDGSRLFTDEWEGLMRRFQVVRFMDWGATNGNPLVSWSDRRKPSDANRGTVTISGRTGERGMPIETMVALCNRTGTDAWINVPPMADSGYVANLVKTLLYGSDGADPYSAPTPNPVWKPLEGNLKLYLEYGNELWNFAGGFNGFAWLHEQSKALQAGARNEPIFFDAQNDEWVSLFRWMGWRAAQMSLWARSGAGDANMMTRVRPVLEGQIGYHAMTGNILPFLESWYGVPRADRTKTYRVRDLFWGNGGATYSLLRGQTTDQVFASGNYPETYLPSAIGADAILAGAYGLHPVSYEGGPAFDSIPAAIEDSVFSDDRMVDLFTQHHRMWTTHGGELAVYYCATGAKNWRFAKSPDDTLSPKLRAVRSLVGTAATAPTLGCVAPCLLRPDTVSNGFAQGGFWTGSEALWGFDPGEWQAFPVSIPESGKWALTLKANADATGNTLEVLLADSLVAERTVSDTKTFSDLAPVEMDLDAGLQVIRVRGKVGRTALSFLEWSRVQSPNSIRTKYVTTRPLQILGSQGAGTNVSIPSDAIAVEVRGIDGRILDFAKIGESTTRIRLASTGRGLRFLRVTTPSGVTQIAAFLN